MGKLRLPPDLNTAKLADIPIGKRLSLASADAKTLLNSNTALCLIEFWWLKMKQLPVKY